MLQTVAGRQVYVVNFTGWPLDLPITWETEEERPYAVALTSAIKAGIVTAAGKYGIHLEHKNGKDTYSIFQIIE